MADLALVMPMAGRGSRFSAMGEMRPKPLIELAGHPFFHWAVESVARNAPVRQKIFVVLEEHIRLHGVDQTIKRYYPDATIVAIPEPTTGAAETAAIGLTAVKHDGPVAFNDCDHAFSAPGLGDLAQTLSSGAAGGLVGFASDNPAYSYVRLSEVEPFRVIETVEKQCVGPYAIAGCYLFRDRAIFEHSFARYRLECPYPELFLSGLYNLIVEDSGAPVLFQPLEKHLSFGTPEELSRVAPRDLLNLFEGQAA